MLGRRLAVWFLGRAPALRAAGIERVEHMSIDRPGVERTHVR